MHEHNQRSAWMAEAVKLSLDNLRTEEGGPFGAVIVKDGKIIARGNNRVLLTNDPTAHAEVVAIREACQTLGTFQLKGCEIYTSCEPCPMCLSALYWARIDKIYYANSRKDAADIGFDDDLIYQEMETPLEQRQLPMEHVHNPQAREVFMQWLQKDDKRLY